MRALRKSIGGVESSRPLPTVSVKRTSGFASAGTAARRLLLVAVSVTSVISTWPSSASAGSLPTTEGDGVPPEHVSVSSDFEPGNMPSYRASVDEDGSHVAFESHASNLVPGDGNGLPDVFVRDRTAGSTERVSASRQGGDPNGASTDPAISADGRIVAFVSEATNLVEHTSDPQPNGRQVYVRDLTMAPGESNAVEMVSGIPGQCADPDLSADGRYVVFACDDPEEGGIFRYDREVGESSVVSRAEAAGEPALSGDGRYVAFTAGGHVFLRDMHGDGVARVDDGGGESGLPAVAMSRGRVVVAYERVLVQGFQQVILVNEVAISRSGDIGEVRPAQIASVTSAGEVSDRHSSRPGLSGDGGLVVFASNSHALDPDRGDDSWEIYVHDRRSGATTRQSTTPDGGASAGCCEPAISSDGRYVAWDSTWPSWLTAPDRCGVCQVYITERVQEAVARIPPRDELAAPELNPALDIPHVPGIDPGTGHLYETFGGPGSNPARNQDPPRVR